MIRLGLVGYPLGHSLSPKLHGAALKHFGLEGEYLLYPVEPEDQHGLAALVERIRRGELTGLNVTIPHKQNVLPLLDALTPSAQAIGAVNTLYLKDDKMIGHNTDAPGFLSDLTGFLGSDPAEKKVIVLGSGGGARAVIYALLDNGWQVIIAALLMDQARALLESMKQVGFPVRCVPNERLVLEKESGGVSLVVNASPVGMSPKVEECPWPDGLAFPEQAAVYDLVYNPRQTLLVQQARQAGLRATTGLGMLVEQARRSFECWTGQLPPRDVMLSAVEAG